MNYIILLIVCILPLSLMPFLSGAGGESIRTEIANHKKTIDDLEQKIKDLNKTILNQHDVIKKNEDAYGVAKADEKFVRENKGKSWTGEQDHIAALKRVDTANETLKNSKEKWKVIFEERNGAFLEIERLDELIDRLDDPSRPKPRVILKGESNLIGITLDNTCKLFIKNNLTSGCPSFEFLNTLYPGSPCDYVEHSCLDYYRQIGGFYYFIDPPSPVADRIKMVEIRYNFEEFHLQDERGYDDLNHTINYQIGRYMDGCKTAYIGSDSWLRYTGDSIYFLSKDCNPAYTNLGGFRSESINQTKHDIASSYKWQLDEWIKESLVKCREKCFEY